MKTFKEFIKEHQNEDGEWLDHDDPTHPPDHGEHRHPVPIKIPIKWWDDLLPIWPMAPQFIPIPVDEDGNVVPVDIPNDTWPCMPNEPDCIPEPVDDPVDYDEPSDFTEPDPYYFNPDTPWPTNGGGVSEG